MRKRLLVAAGCAALSMLLGWVYMRSFEARDPWDMLGWLFRRDLLVVDELSAPKLPLAALIYFLTTLATLRTKVRDFWRRCLASSRGVSWPCSPPGRSPLTSSCGRAGSRGGSMQST